MQRFVFLMWLLPSLAHKIIRFVLWSRVKTGLNVSRSKTLNVYSPHYDNKCSILVREQNIQQFSKPNFGDGKFVFSKYFLN